MAEEKEKNKGGRPPKILNGEYVISLARMGCINQEIADFFKVDEKTIRTRFPEELREGRSEMKVGLRQKQVGMALAGDKTMLIWLGKQYLGQADRQEVSGPKGGPIEHTMTVEEKAKRLERVKRVLEAAGGNPVRNNGK